MTEARPLRRRIPTPHARDLEVVLVEWSDANLGSDDGPPESISRNATEVQNVTVGYLLRQDRKHVVLVIDVSPAEGTVRWPYTIPKRMVTSIHRTGVTATTREVMNGLSRKDAHVPIAKDP